MVTDQQEDPAMSTTTSTDAAPAARQHDRGFEAVMTPAEIVDGMKRYGTYSDRDRNEVLDEVIAELKIRPWPARR